MIPYYDKDGITIYLGDCRDVLPCLEADSADLVLADPPYNVGRKYGEHDDSMSPLDYSRWMCDWLELAARVTKHNVLMFPGTKNMWDLPYLFNQAGLRPYRMLGWHKKEFAGDKWNGGPAMCWEPIAWATKVDKPPFTKIYGSQGRDFLVVNATHGNPYAKLHPAVKPEKVMSWLINLFTDLGSLVLDPFMGSGTTLRAAKDLGRKAIGIEIEEKYCEIAVKRLAQEVMAL